MTEEERSPGGRLRVLLDTSVLVAALVEDLPQHARAAAEMRRATKEDEACVAVHALAEAFAVLTTLPVSPRITPGQARRLVRHNVTEGMEAVALDRSDYDAVVDRMTDLGLSGGMVYDALHVRAAEKTGASRLVTFNRRDFERFSAVTEVEIVVL